MSIKVENVVSVCEVDGEERLTGGPTITVKSHWNINAWVVLCIAGKEYTVVGDDLTRAIRNAMNT